LGTQFSLGIVICKLAVQVKCSVMHDVVSTQQLELCRWQVITTSVYNSYCMLTPHATYHQSKSTVNFRLVIHDS